MLGWLSIGLLVMVVVVVVVVVVHLAVHQQLLASHSIADVAAHTT
jgi:hypothetical protein